jgi:hypothetical protein
MAEPRHERVSRERMERLVKYYHSSIYASEATGISSKTLNRLARKYKLKFRDSQSREED